ncbi:MAG: O-antigen ligase family protein [Caldilineaceae bacterium]
MIFFEIFLFVLPSIVLVLKSIQATDARWGYLLAGLYAYPLLVFTMISAEGYSIPSLLISVDTANNLRVGSHIILSSILILQLINLRSPVLLDKNFIFALFTILWMLISVLFTQTGNGDIQRGFLTLILASNSFLFIPSIVQYNQKAVFRSICWSVMFISIWLCLISVYVIYQYGFFPSWSNRLGRPFNSGALSQLLVIGFICSLYLFRYRFMALSLFGATILCASRLDTLLVLVLGVIYFFSSRRRLPYLFLIIPFAFLAFTWYSSFVATLDRSPFQRSEFFSGRLDPWLSGVQFIEERPLFGNGTRTSAIEQGSDGIIEEVSIHRVHNLYLELMQSYGILAGIFAALIYLSLFYRSLKHITSISSSTSLFIGILVLIVTFSHTLVDTSSWTNLGDGITLLAFLIINIAMMETKKVSIDKQISTKLKSSSFTPIST